MRALLVARDQPRSAPIKATIFRFVAGVSRGHAAMTSAKSSGASDGP